MYTLIIDTSTKKSLVVFADGVRVLLTLPLPFGHQSSSYLMQTVEFGFKELKILVSSLKAIAVGVGPGSYTGTRVGVAAAKGLSFPHSIPLIGFCSLEGFISKKEEVFASVIDARMGDFYCLIQENRGDAILPLGAPKLVSAQELEEMGQTICSPENCAPDPEHLARLVQIKFERNEFDKDLKLNYLRTPSYTV